MNKKIPMRMCVGCGEMKEKRDLIRVIKTAEGIYELDKTGKKNGRGAYLCNNPECLKNAVKRGGFERSFKEKLPKEIYEKLLSEFEEKDGQSN